MQAALFCGQLLPFCCPTLVMLLDVAIMAPVSSSHVTAPGSHHPSPGTRDLVVAIEAPSGDSHAEGLVNGADDWCMSPACPVSQRKS